MQDPQSIVNYWTQRAFDWRLGRWADDYEVALIGDSRTMMLGEPVLAGRKTLNLGLSGARVSTLANITQWQLQPPVIQPGIRSLFLNIGINDVPIPTNDPEFTGFAASINTLIAFLKTQAPNLIVSTFMPYETLNATTMGGNTTLTPPQTALGFVSTIQSFNSAIRSAAASNLCALCDIAAATSGADGTATLGSTVDETHYSNRTAQLVKSLMAGSIFSAFGSMGPN